jgi:hypothetical protein
VAKLAACRRPCLATPSTWRSGVARVAAPSTHDWSTPTPRPSRRPRKQSGTGKVRDRIEGRTGHSGRFHRQIQGTSPLPQNPRSIYISRPDIPLGLPTSRPTPSSIAVEGTESCCVTLPCIQALIFQSVRKFGIVEDGDTCPTSSCRIFFRRASLPCKGDASIS